MGFRIGSSQNQTTLFAQRQLTIHRSRANRAMERLASGRRLNRAADGPAELATAQILEQAAIAVLAQSTAQDRVVLQLLDGATGALDPAAAEPRTASL